MSGIVSPVPELSAIGSGGGGCSVSEIKGLVQIIHECVGQSGTFWTVESDGVIRFTAPEFDFQGSNEFAFRCGDGVEIVLTVGRVFVRQGTANITIENGEIHLNADKVYANDTLLSSRP